VKGKLASVICVITFSLLFGSPSAFAVSVPVPNTTVFGSNVFSGPSFLVSGNFNPSDTIDLTASGTVDLASGQFTANAAGVIVAPDPTNTGNSPGETADFGGFPLAALMISKNGGVFVPFFPADATTGLGDPTPPTTIIASS